MRSRVTIVATLVVAGVLSMRPLPAGAQGCPGGVDITESPACSCLVTFSQTFTGGYRHGEPADVLTIDPSGTGETFAGRGITIRIRLTGEQSGIPWAGVPAEEIVLFNTALCLCPGGNIADHATDQDGRTEFSGTLRGGGCADRLDLFVCGILVAHLPIRINSTDFGPAPCFTEVSDLALLSTKLGRPDGWDLCHDYNESGAPIDASDLAYFASAFGASCR